MRGHSIPYEEVVPTAMHRPAEPTASPSLGHPLHGPAASSLDRRRRPSAGEAEAGGVGGIEGVEDENAADRPAALQVLAGQDADPGASADGQHEGIPDRYPVVRMRLHGRRGIGRVVGHDRRHRLPGFDEGPRLGRREAELAGRDVVELDQDLERQEERLAADQRDQKLDSAPCRSPAAPSAA